MNEGGRWFVMVTDGGRHDRRMQATMNGDEKR